MNMQFKINKKLSFNLYKDGIPIDHNFMMIDSLYYESMNDRIALMENDISIDKVLCLYEPRTATKLLHDWISVNYDKFRCILTYDLELLKISKKFRFFAHAGSYIEKKDHKLHSKSKDISMFISNQSWGDGHKLRLEVLDFYNIDFFGSGVNNFVENKIDALKDYKYHIVIENSNINDYFSEKIIDCFLTGTIPIYWGTSNINKYFDNVIQFETIYDLKFILKNLNAYTYDASVNFKKAKKYLYLTYFHRIHETYRDIFYKDDLYFSRRIIDKIRCPLV